MEHPVALREGGGTYRWHAGAPDDETFDLALGELVGRIDARLSELGLEPLALEPVEPEAGAGGSLEGEPESGAGVRARVTDEYVVEAYGKTLLELGAGTSASSSSTPTSPRTAASARSSSPTRTGSSSAASPSRTWSRPPQVLRARASCPS